MTPPKHQREIKKLHEIHDFRMIRRSSDQNSRIHQYSPNIHHGFAELTGYPLVNSHSENHHAE